MQNRVSTSCYSEESRPLTTFSSHCRLFRFKRLPFGIACAPEVFQRVVSDIVHGLPGVMVYIDDLLIFGKDREEHDRHMQAVLQRLSAADLKLNWSKCHLRQNRVKYLGHWLSAGGVMPDDEKLKAIQEMANPKSRSDIRRFLGMATYLGKFIPRLSQITDPLRKLMKNQDPLVVDDALIVAFNAAKAQLAVVLQELAFFQSAATVPTAITTDASPQGLGAVLWQQNVQGQWLPVCCISRCLTDVESRYSQMEREMLGVVFSLTRFRQYVLGRNVTVFTDHKPLVSIVKNSFDDVPPRLQRWLVALMPYQYELCYRPGNQMLGADALSRAPMSGIEASSAEARSMSEFVSLILEACPVKLEDIRRAIQDDETLQHVMQRVLTASWSECKSIEEPYYMVRDQLTVVDGVLMLKNRYVIPESLRTAVLKLAHEGHPGTDAFLDSLKSRVWWPRITKDANLFAERCSVCYRRRRNQPSELLPSEIEGIWQKLAIDLVTIEGQHFCSVIDYGSRWPEILHLNITTTSAVIERLMELFARFGLPRSIVSDWGPQFASEEFGTFLKQLGVVHTKSSPRYARSNGMVERLHRVIKERVAGLPQHLKLNVRLQQVLFDIRNSRHRMLGTSPGQALFSRALQTRVPEHIDPRFVELQHQMSAKAQMAMAHDSRRGVGPLSPLQSGEPVLLQDGYYNPRKKWRVVAQHGRQVAVTDGCRIVLRNRQHVREFGPPTVSSMPNNEGSGEDQSDLPVSQTSNAPAVSPTVQDELPVHGEPLDVATPDITSESPPTQPVIMQKTKNVPVFKEGVVTRSGRTVKLSLKAREAVDNV